MKKSTKRMILWIALAAIGGIVIGYLLQRCKQLLAAKLEAAGAQAETEAAGVQPGTEAADRRQAAPADAGADAEALARVIASEAGERGQEAQTRVAWVVRNRAEAKRTTIADLVGGSDGRERRERGPFSIQVEPSASHRELAAIVMAARAEDDPTRGATHFLDPSRADRRFAAGKAKHSARALRRRRLQVLDYYGSAEGLDFFGPPGGAGAQPVPAAWGLQARNLFELLGEARAA